MARKSILEKKSQEVQVLDETTRELLASIERKDKRRRFWGTMAFLILFLTGITSVYYTIALSRQNKEHIDCIVKLLATPQKPGTTHKFISGDTCNIKFT